jgi:hypothetical protein
VDYLGSTLNTILGTILGWLLGILSYPIVSQIQKYLKRKDLKKAILSELESLSVRLLLQYIDLQLYFGEIDKKELEWIRNLPEKHRKYIPENLIEAVNKLLNFSEEELKFSSFLYYLLTYNPNKAIRLKTFEMPFIKSVLSNLSVFDIEFQSSIFDIWKEISILNQEIEQAMFYSRLTFDPSCMDANQEIIRYNLKNSYKFIKEKSKTIVDKIEKILEREKSK